MSAQATEYLNYYLDPRTPADAAVLITGPWGSGKSYFVKRFMEARDAKFRAEDALNGRKHLYASLYGVKSVDEITAQFFAQAHPMLDSRAVRLIGTMGARAINAVSGGSGVKDGDARALRQLFTRLEGFALVFDDLERSALPISDVMGFINAYVEHEGLKTIVVASEGDVPKDQLEAYGRRKEKLIGKTLTVRSDPEEVYDSLASKLRAPKAKAAAERHRAIALETFISSESYNFRSLRAVLDDFDRLIAGADARLGEAPTAVQSLLGYMIATGVELRAGSIRSTDLPALTQVAMGMHPGLYSKGDLDGSAADAQRLKALIDKYPGVTWSDPIIPPEELARLYQNGDLNLTAIDAHLSQHPSVVGIAEAPAWRRLWAWPDLTRLEYENARREILDDLEKYKLVSPAIILHATGVLITLKDQGDRLLGRRGVGTFIRGYLRHLLHEEALVPDPGFLSDGVEDGSGWGGLGFASSESPEFKKAFAEVVKAVDRAFAQRMKTVAPALLQRLREGPPYSMLHEHGYGDEHFGEAPILHHLDPSDVADLCFSEGRPNRALIAALAKRYTEYGRGQALRAEEPWTRKLRQDVDKRVALLPRPQRNLAESIAGQYFTRIEKAFA